MTNNHSRLRRRRRGASDVVPVLVGVASAFSLAGVSLSILALMSAGCTAPQDDNVVDDCTECRIGVPDQPLFPPPQVPAEPEGEPEAPEPVVPPEEAEQGNNVASGPLVLMPAEQTLVALLPRTDEVVAINVVTGEVVSQLVVPGGVRQATAVDKDTVAVSLYQTGEVALLDIRQGRELSRTHVGSGPVGLSTGFADPDLVIVALSVDQAIAVVDVVEGTLVDTHGVPLPDPREVALADFGLVVGFGTPANIGRFEFTRQGLVPVEVSTVSGNTTQAGQLTNLVLAAYETIHFLSRHTPSDPEAFDLTGEQGDGSATIPYYASAAGNGGAFAVITGAALAWPGTLNIAAFSEGIGPIGRPAVHAGAAAMVVVNYWGARVIVYSGSGTVGLSNLGEGSAEERTPWHVGVGANAIVTKQDRSELYVLNPLTRTVHVGELGNNLETNRSELTPRRILELPAPHPAARELDPDVEAGRVLFLSTDDRLSQSRGVACASCHPGGGPDGKTWPFPDGPRQTPPLWGNVLDTAPLHWNHDMEGISALNSVTIQGRMGGKGLSERELEQLAAYLTSCQPPPLTATRDEQAIERGRLVFESPETQCTACHSGPQMTDGLMHDVTTGEGYVPRETLIEVATPPLVGLKGSAPYMHHGVAPTLDLLVDGFVRTDRMGIGSHLTDGEAADLVAYLESL